MNRKHYLSALALMIMPMMAIAQTPGELAGLIDDESPNYVQLDKTGASQCVWFSVEDGADYFLPHGFTAARATYGAPNDNLPTPSTSGRTYSGSFSGGSTVSTTGYSLYLPYDFTLPSGMAGYALSQFKTRSEEENNTFVFVKQSSSKLSANVPYLIRIEGATASITDAFETYDNSNGIYVPASPVGLSHSQAPDVTATNPKQVGDTDGTVIELTRKSVSGTKTGGVTWTMFGTTENINSATPTSITKAWSNGSYMFATDGKWYSAKINNWAITPFRVFLYPDTPGAVASKAMFGGFVDANGNTTTSIDEIIDGNDSMNPAVYSIGGQYLGTDMSGLPKGIYIVNGKKVIK